MKKLILIKTLILLAAIASAQIIHVPGDQPTIQAGIDAASDDDTVLVAENTYYENIRFMGKAITVASHYVLDGDTNHINNTIIDGSLPAYADSAACVMFVHGEDTASILSGFTLTGGSGVWTTGLNVRSGGGVFAWESGAKIMHNKIMYNQVESDSGGGAGLEFLGGDEYWAVIDSNTISHNTSISDGFSAFGAGMSILVNAIIKNNLIEHNTCINTTEMADGAGIELEKWAPNSEQYVYVHNNIIRYNTLNSKNAAVGAGIMSLGVSCELNNNTIKHNEAISDNNALGGGFYTYAAEDSTTIVKNNIINNNLCQGVQQVRGSGFMAKQTAYLTVVANDFSENTMSSTYGSSIGGGLFINRPVNSVTASRNIIKNNLASGTSYGGGCSIYFSDSVFVLFESNHVENNSAEHGGGLYLRNAYNATLYNNIIRGNTAAGQGGGIRFWHYIVEEDEASLGDDPRMPVSLLLPNLKSSVHPFLSNNNFLNNTASSGGAIYSNYEANMPVFLNNIFRENEALYYNAIYMVPENAVFNMGTCDIDEEEVRGTWLGHGNFIADPLFIDDSCHLNCWQPSPCINKGDEYIDVDGQMYYAPLTDIDGIERPLDNIWDVGADEEVICTWISQDMDEEFCSLEVTPNPSSGALHLRYSILDTRYLIFEVYSADGVKVKTLFSGKQPAGKHTMNVDLSDLPDGLYFIRMQAGERAETAKIILLK